MAIKLKTALDLIGIIDDNTDNTIVAQPGDDLAVKYTDAAALTPGSAALSATNRARLVLMPGTYALAAEWAVNTNFVDVIGLGGGSKPAVELTGFTINVTATNVLVKGINVGTQQFKVTHQANFTGVTGTASNNRITITGHGLAVDDVVRFTAITGGSGLSTGVRYRVASVAADYFTLAVESTGSSATFTTDITDGTLTVDNNTQQVIDTCTGGLGSFGYLNTASGTFTNCIGGDYSFASEGTASGTFTNCTGGSSSFGGDFGTASGTFTNCVGGDSSFGGVGTASGTFTKCTGGGSSFGGLGTASGTFTNCVGDTESFGRFSTLSGKLYRCRLTSGSFQTVSGSGITRLCLDGSNVENNQG